MRASFRFASPLILVLLAAGCSTKATISRVNGPPVDAKIVGGDVENLYVEEEGGREKIARKDITDIDHPGDGATVAGAIVAGYGALNIAVGEPMCKDKGAAFCVGVFTPLPVGLAILVWGIATHARSVNASETMPSNDEARVFLAPLVPTEKGQPAGASVVGTF